MLLYRDDENVKKVKELEHAAVNFGPDDISDLCARRGQVKMSARALGLACRFRGVDCVRALVEGGARFEAPAVKKAENDEEEEEESYSLEYNYSNYSLYLLNIEKQIKGAACCSGIKFPKKVKLENGKTLTQISDIERVKVLDLLCEYSEKLCFDPAELLYYSIFVRDDVITGELKKLGAGLSPDRVKALTSVRDKDIRYWIEFGSMMNKLSDEDFIPVISKLYSELGKKLRVSKKTFDSMRSRHSNDAIIECFKEKFELKGVPKSFILRKALKRNDTVSLVLAEKIGWLAEARRRDLLIDYSIKDNAVECTAWLLDFKNRTADLTAEREKAERKLEHELNAAPDSVTALKVLWSYGKLEDGTLIIKRYKGDQTEITVPKKIGKSIVTVIGKYAFSPAYPRLNDERKNFLETIKKVTLPDTIIKINENAFFSCDKLETVNIPDSVMEIGKKAFSYCEKLSCVKLPDGLTEIPYGLFSGCRSLHKINVPDSIKKIGGVAFGYCFNLTEIVIPDSVTEIKREAFAGCKSLGYVKLPNGLTEIPYKLFIDCGKLKEITIPDSVRSIGHEAFEWCEALTKIVIPNGVVAISNGAFACCISLETVVLPSSIKQIHNEPYDIFLRSPNATAVVEKGSYAENYCKQNNIPYKYKE